MDSDSKSWFESFLSEQLCRDDTTDSEPESKLRSLISQLMSIGYPTVSEFISFSVQLISLVNSLDLESQPKPESKLMSLFTQTISLFNSMDFDSQPKPMSELILLITHKVALANSTSPGSGSELKPDPCVMSLFCQTLRLKPEPKLISLIYQIVSLAKSGNLNTLCPRVQIRLEQGKFHVKDEVSWKNVTKWECLPSKWERFRFNGEDDTHFLCQGCNGENHQEYEKAPVEIKHPLHQKHSLQLVLLRNGTLRRRNCYCCDEYLIKVFYYCSACDFAMNIACVEKTPTLSKDHPKWHEHTLALFTSQASLPCNLCALTHSSCPFYICPLCDFVVHQSCISLPRVIRISRHRHRISFTPSFDQRDWSCGVCQTKIKNDYGGYSCIKDHCFYTAHSRCATQKNVWDGKELEGEAEETEDEELEPFVRISYGIIHHFSHQQHYLRLDENKGRDYDDTKDCQACIMPIYYGNFYSCMQCDFILHEVCAEFSRKIYHPIHPHLLNLVGGYDDVMNYRFRCSACPWRCTGFYYECSKRGCNFKVHVQCGTITEPLVHESHMHPLFLTSKPGKHRRCRVCINVMHMHTNETFNCTECDFSLCFDCAILPQKVKYKHDKHMLFLSYGEETSSMTYWCEACEGKINPRRRFYKCDEYCCVTLHIECLLGKESAFC